MKSRLDAWRAGAYWVERGNCLPFGATPVDRGVNFSLFSQHASEARLVLFHPGEETPADEIPLDHQRNRTGDVWHILVQDLPPNLEYGWRLDGPLEPHKGHRFNRNLVLMDPYARLVAGGAVWGHPEYPAMAENNRPVNRRRCKLPSIEFQWEGDTPPRIPMADTIIYELHVRGYTVHPSAQSQHPGSFLGLTEKIPYLQELGVTAVELMPVFEFDELEHHRHHPQTNEPLLNFWGYSPISFFAPNASYAAGGKEGDPVADFKTMIKKFHQAGMEVILDVVFNHTAEGDERGPTLSLRGIDNSIYYMLDQHGNYRNFSGCGNTVNCNHPLIRDMILDSLRYWVSEMHVDGFRFDLAAILGRGPTGEVLANPPLLERIAMDPVLAETKLIAEAWDAAGLNQVGKFPSWGRWAEWNGYFRDQVRLFWKGERGFVSYMASRICGSADLYGNSGRRPYHSINFITAHDGFTMNDLVSYAEKHNVDNGEENRDGEEYNHSQNFGAEGPTGDEHINRRRQIQVKSFFATLLLSQGVPMLLGGDEFMRTQRGNNNPYCQDNEINWIDWNLCEQNTQMVRFTQNMIAFRKRHPVLRRSHFFADGSSDISWHGERAGQPDWSEDAQALAFLLDGHRVPGDTPDSRIFVMMNASSDWKHFEVPHVGGEWRKVIDTTAASPDDSYLLEGEAPSIGEHHGGYGVEAGGVVVLVAT